MSSKQTTYLPAHFSNQENKGDNSHDLLNNGVKAKSPVIAVFLMEDRHEKPSLYTYGNLVE
jgi:hypothetical protein